MNREVWFRILQVAVVAPWLYHVSGKTNEKYFRIGLKLVAGSIIALNIKPLMNDYANAQKLLTDIAKQMPNVSVVNDKTVIEGESETVSV